MTRLLITAIALLLNACATPSEHQPVQIAWVKLDDVTTQCGKFTNGCFVVRQGGVCHVYTRKPRGIWDDEVHRTLGHEARHCFEGYFHGKDRLPGML